MTQTGFYILLCLREEMLGYSIVQKAAELRRHPTEPRHRVVQALSQALKES